MIINKKNLVAQIGEPILRKKTIEVNPKHIKSLRIKNGSPLIFFCKNEADVP